MAIEVDTSLPTEWVIRVLEQVVAWRSQAQAIRLDNGPEFLADRFKSALRVGVRTEGSRCGIFSRVNRIRMPLWNGSIGRSSS